MHKNTSISIRHLSRSAAEKRCRLLLIGDEMRRSKGCRPQPSAKEKEKAKENQTNLPGFCPSVDAELLGESGSPLLDSGAR